MTNLGRFLTDEDHPWKKPVHKDSNVLLITYAAFMLEFCNKNACSETEMESLLQMVHSVSVPDNRLPKSYKELCKITDELVVDHEEHFVCPCGFFTFKKELSCPACNKSRTDAHRYYTIPLAPRLKQMLEVPSLSELLVKEKGSIGPFLEDIHSTPAWHKFHEQMESGESNRTVAISYCSDGFNPYHHQATSRNYSIWAQSGIILNLPADVRINNPLLFGLICGPSTPTNINSFNRIIVDELAELKKGVVAYDGFEKCLTVLKAGVMMMVCDVPGAAKEQNRVQHSSLKACPHCHIEGEHSPILDKVIFLGNRRFLSEDNGLRQESSFACGTVETGIVQLRCNREELSYARCLDSLRVEELMTRKVDKPLFAGFARDTGRHGSHEWFRLGLDLSQEHAPVEPMHAIKVVADHVIRIINGTDDGPKLRTEERSRGRFVDCCPDGIFKAYSKQNKAGSSVPNNDSLVSCELPSKRSRSTKEPLPPAPFVLSKQEKEKADTRLRGVRVPIDFGDMPSSLFTKTYGMKSHTWMKIFTSGILRYVLRDCLGGEQRRTLFRFLRSLEVIYSRQLSVLDLDQIESEWHISLALMERDFPCAMQGAVMHLLHHLPHYLRKFGPVSNFWMYPFERLNSTLSRAISSTRYPELAAIKHMKIQWLLYVLQAAGYLRQEQEQKEKKGIQLTGGRTTVRRLTSEEEQDVVNIYSNMGVAVSSNRCVTVFFYAKKFVQYMGSTVTYRAAQLEDKTIQKSSIVCEQSARGPCIGQVQFFFSHQNGTETFEFASVKWFGVAKSVNGGCYCVSADDHLCRNTVTLLDRLSPPLVHAWEDKELWLPCLN